MPWIVVDLDECLITESPPMPMMDEMGQPMDPSMGGMDPAAQQGSVVPVDGAVEALTQLVQEGHRVTVYTSRFAPMPDSSRLQWRQELEQVLVEMGFPPIEIWTGTSKPAADIFIGSNNVTFDGDWGLALAQSQMMMEEMGLVPPPTGMDPSMEGQDPNMMGQEEQPMEEPQQPAPKKKEPSKPTPKDKKKEKK